MEGVSASAKKKMFLYLAVFVLLCIFSLFAGRLAPHDPELANLMAAKKAPGGEYLMGTDWLGRCIWSRVLAGAKSSIFASLVIVVLSMLIGCTLGVVSGYAGGRVDEVIMRLVDIFMAFPGIVLSIAVAGMLGPGLKNGVLALAATSWTQYARLIRSYVLSIRQENLLYAEAASNYTIVYYLKNDKVERLLLRSTFKKVEEQLIFLIRDGLNIPMSAESAEMLPAM